jgi:hypothetical protein
MLRSSLNCIQEVAFEIGKRDVKWFAVELQRHTQALAQENVEAPEKTNGSDPFGAANASPSAAHVYEQQVVKPPALECGTRARGQSSVSLVEVHNCASHGDDRKAKVLQCDILHSGAERFLDSTEYELDRDSRQNEAHDSGNHSDAGFPQPPQKRLTKPERKEGYHARQNDRPIHTECLPETASLPGYYDHRRDRPGPGEHRNSEWCESDVLLRLTLD